MRTRNVPLYAVLTIAFFVTLAVAPALPSAFAHGGHQPPPANFEGKEASLFVTIEPLIVTGATDPVSIKARFFDENTNENFKQVTYRVFFEKDGERIPIIASGGKFGGQGFFYDPEGDLELKIVPTDSESAVASGEPETQFGGIWNRGSPIVVEGPIFTEPGLYNLFIEIHTAGTTRTMTDPVLQYDVWVAPGREEIINVSEGGQTHEVMVRNYYGAISDSGYDSETKTIEFSMPFDWTSDLASRIGMLHTEVFIPKTLSDFDRESLAGAVNGVEVPVYVDTFTPNATVVHFTISQKNLQNIADRVRSENLSTGHAKFSLSPLDPESEIHVAKVSADSENYKVSLSWPEQLFPEQPVTFGVRIADRSDNPVSAATYELVILDGDGNEVSRAGGVTTPEGISSQDVAFTSQGSFTVKVEKINASSESVQSSLTVVPEFPAGIASVAAALAIGAIMAAKRASFLQTGKTY